MNISIFLLYFLTLLSILLSPLYDITRLSLFGFLPTTLLEILLLGTFCFWIIIKIKRRDFSWPKTSLDKLIVFLLLGSFISILLGPHKIFSIGRWRAFFLEPIIFYYLIIDLYKFWPNLTLILNNYGGQKIASLLKKINFEFLLNSAILLTALWLSILGIMQYYLNIGIITPEQSDRAHAVYNIGNHLTNFLGPVLLLTILRRKEFNSKYVFTLIIAVLALAFWGTDSLGGNLALIIAVIILFINKFIHENLFYKLLRFGSLLGILVFLVFLSQIHYFAPPIENPWERPRDTAQIRLCLWQGATNLLKNHPFFGVGMAGFSELYRNQYYTCDAEAFGDADNFVLDFWIKTGALGLVGIILLFWSIFSYRNLQYQIPFIYWYFHGMVDVSYFKNDISLLWWTFTALLVLQKIDVTNSYQLNFSKWINLLKIKNNEPKSTEPSYK